MRDINEIIIHTLATPKGWMHGKSIDQKVAEVKRWHTDERGWSDIGYHYVIGREGEAREGRPLERAGAHVKGHNKNSIGISLEGGKGGNRRDAFLDNFTVEQGTALLNMIERLQKEFGPLKISGHYYYANKECPCFNVTEFLNQTPLKAEPIPVTTKGTAAAVGVTGLFAAIAVWWDEIQAWIGNVF